MMVLALVIFSLGVFDNLKQKSYNNALNEVLDLITLFNNEIRFRNSDFFELRKICAEQNYKFIVITEDFILLNKSYKFSFEKEFCCLISKIGTTDVEGQLSLCREYSEKFNSLLIEGKEKEKTKLKVNFALSTLGALSIIVVFL